MVGLAVDGVRAARPVHVMDVPRGAATRTWHRERTTIQRSYTRRRRSLRLNRAQFLGVAFKGQVESEIQKAIFIDCLIRDRLVLRGLVQR